MMKSRKKNRALTNDLDWLDPDQELIDEDDDLERFGEKRPDTLRESISRGIRTTIAIIICLVIPFLWYFDWDFSAFADSSSEFVTGIFNDDDVVNVAPIPPIPDIPSIPEIQGSLDISMTDYAAELNDRGFLEKVSGPGVTALYQNSVPIEYLAELDNVNMLDELSFPAIVAFYANSIPIDYINRLNTVGFDDLSFPAIIAFYKQDVSIDYLQRLDQADFLDNLSFPAIAAFYKNEVTIEFLQELNQRNLLDNLSYPDIVNMYKNQ